MVQYLDSKCRVIGKTYTFTLEKGAVRKYTERFVGEAKSHKIFLFSILARVSILLWMNGIDVYNRCIQFRIPNSSGTHVFGLWEKPKTLEETHATTGRTYKLNTQDQDQI